MSDEEQKKIFAKNLNQYLSETNKSQKEVADAIGVLPSTFNTWCQGNAFPRMGKVQALADYFSIHKSDLIDEKRTDVPDYYLNEKTRQIAKEAFENPQLQTLFQLAKDIPHKHLKAYIDFLQSLKEEA